MELRSQLRIVQFSQRATLIQHSQDWQATGEQISKRWPSWTQLQTLLSHAKDLAPYQALAAEAELADWLAEAEARIRAKLEDGPVMI
ncbi:MAG: hypothetical protein K9L82_00685 [Chromatiaceae bacterium]|nr:hypothetical protein [Chromatiaceae bacterium]MCF7994817.1 hypothetical protein [Chromatiaceae bacterium]MCF8016169.1 hypothetical protein [Chromatiaceae bacterium]